MVCSEPNAPSREMNVLLYTPNARARPIFTPAQPTPRPPLVPLKSSAFEAFFAFVGDKSSPVTEAFKPSALLPFLRWPGPIRLVVEAIGELKLDQVHGGTPDCRKTSQASQKLRQCLISLLPDGKNSLQHSTLLFVMLLAVFEVRNHG